MTSQTYPLRHVDLDYEVDDVRQRYLRLSSGQVCDSLSERAQVADGAHPLDVHERIGRF